MSLLWRNTKKCSYFASIMNLNKVRKFCLYLSSCMIEQGSTDILFTCFLLLMGTDVTSLIKIIVRDIVITTTWSNDSITFCRKQIASRVTTHTDTQTTEKILWRKQLENICIRITAVRSVIIDPGKERITLLLACPNSRARWSNVSSTL